MTGQVALDQRRNRLDASAVREAARGRWREALPVCGVPPAYLQNRHGSCPACRGRDRFRFDDRDGRGTFICSQGGGEPLSGDGFALLQHVHGCGFQEALRMVADALGIGPGDPLPATPRQAPAPAPAKPAKRTTLAPDQLKRWHRTRVITADDVAGVYLTGRGCALPPADGDLAWHPKVKHWPTDYVGPALIAKLTDPETCEPVTLHFTWIKPDGSGKADVEPSRLTLPNHSNRGLVRLWPDAEVTLGLAVCEGLESSLTVARGFQPVWSTVNANNMRKLPHLPGVGALTIVCDNDDAGLKAARECADRWAAAGAEVRLWRADQEGADPNDTWGSAA